MATGELLTLSRQNLVDCAPNPDQCGGTGGCFGSTAELAFSYVAQNGIATEAAYPYTVQRSARCHRPICVAHSVVLVVCVVAGCQRPVQHCTSLQRLFDCVLCVVWG
jgi:hypothetical protein